MLTDAGPLAALIDRRDQNHLSAQKALTEQIKDTLITTVPCFTEAMHLLGRYGHYEYQSHLAQMVIRESLILHNLSPETNRRAFTLMRQYRDRPMSYADASLIATAEILRLQRIFTFDSDFHFYRLADGSALEVIP